jgi:hypothetical protein
MIGELKGKFDRQDGVAAYLQPLRRHVAAVAGKADDRRRGQQAGEAEDDDVEPGRRPVVVAERFRQVGEQPDLDLVDQLEESPGGERDEDADRRRHHQQWDQASRHGPTIWARRGSEITCFG